MSWFLSCERLFLEIKCVRFPEFQLWFKECRPGSLQAYKAISSSEHLIIRHSCANLYGNNDLFSSMILKSFTELGSIFPL